MANIILVNKADDPLDQTANQTLLEYRSAMKFTSSRKKVHTRIDIPQLPPQVLPISGRTGRGITEAWDTINTIYTSQAVSANTPSKLYLLATRIRSGAKDKNRQANGPNMLLSKFSINGKPNHTGSDPFFSFQDYIEALPKTSPASRLADESLYASAQKLVEEWQASVRG